MTTKKPEEVTKAPSATTPDKAQEELEARSQEFVDGYKELSDKTQMAVECLISQTGPTASLVDLKKKDGE